MSSKQSPLKAKGKYVDGNSEPLIWQTKCFLKLDLHPKNNSGVVHVLAQGSMEFLLKNNVFNTYVGKEHIRDKKCVYIHNVVDFVDEIIAVHFKTLSI